MGPMNPEELFEEDGFDLEDEAEDWDAETPGADWDAEALGLDLDDADAQSVARELGIVTSEL